MDAVRGGRRRGGGSAAPPDRRREKRRELDARRSRCRIRLGGGHLERWCRLKEQLGFALHSQLAQFLLDRYNGCGRSSGDLDPEVLPAAALQRLVVLSHGHGQECGFVPDVKAPAPGAASHLVWECVAGHTFSWGVPEVTTAGHHPGDDAGRRRSLRRAARSPGGDAEVEGDDGDEGRPAAAEGAGRPPPGPQEAAEGPAGGEDEEVAEEDDDDDLAYADDLRDETYRPAPDSDSEPQRRQNHPRARKKPVKEEEPPQEPVPNPTEEKTGRVSSKRRPRDDDVAQIGPKRIRKAAKREILLCDFEGCGKIFSNRQYLNHHKKYQHVHQKTFTCSEPSCGKSFNFKKHLKEHEKLHSDKRDYICEFCARPFRTSSNLIIHRRIHTGEKPLQCEICGFTCRQKASLNWHMRKHAADTFYRFSCDLCGKRFEKKDNVAAHKSKSHPAPPGGAPHGEAAAENPEGSAAAAAPGVASGSREEETPPGEEGGAGRAAAAENA